MHSDNDKKEIIQNFKIEMKKEFVSSIPEIKPPVQAQVQESQINKFFGFFGKSPKNEKPTKSQHDIAGPTTESRRFSQKK